MDTAATMHAVQRDGPRSVRMELCWLTCNIAAASPRYEMDACMPVMPHDMSLACLCCMLLLINSLCRLHQLLH